MLSQQSSSKTNGREEEFCLYLFSSWVLNIDFSIYFASYRHKQRTAVGKLNTYLVFNSCQQDAHKTQQSGNSYIKTPHTVYTELLHKEVASWKTGQKKGTVLLLFSLCTMKQCLVKTGTSLQDITDEATKRKKQEVIKKKITLTVWSKKMSSDSDKFMISEKPIQAKSEHSQSKNREETYVHWLFTVLSHPVPPLLLANWPMQPSGNSVYYIWTWAL